MVGNNPLTCGPFHVVFREGLTVTLEYHNGDSLEVITCLREELPELENITHEASLVHHIHQVVEEITNSRTNLMPFRLNLGVPPNATDYPYGWWQP